MASTVPFIMTARTCAPKSNAIPTMVHNSISCALDILSEFPIAETYLKPTKTSARTQRTAPTFTISDNASDINLIKSLVLRGFDIPVALDGCALPAAKDRETQNNVESIINAIKEIAVFLKKLFFIFMV